MKNLVDFEKLLKDVALDTKIQIYLSVRVAGDDFDPYQQNYTQTNLNPITIHGHVRAITPEALVWKQYGLQQNGAVEILVEKRYRTYFENANRIVIDGTDYQVLKAGTGNRGLIMDRPFHLLRVILTRAG